MPRVHQPKLDRYAAEEPDRENEAIIFVRAGGVLGGRAAERQSVRGNEDRPLAHSAPSAAPAPPVSEHAIGAMTPPAANSSLPRRCGIVRLAGSYAKADRACRRG